MKTMNSILAVVVLLSILISGGCSNNYRVTYNSDPIGAILYCGGKNYGYTPVTLTYKIEEHNKQSGKIRCVPCYARWISGAKRSYSSEFSIKKFPNGVMQTLPRPNVEGYSKDVEFALKIKQMRIQKRQADELENMNNRMINCFTVNGLTTCY